MQPLHNKLVNHKTLRVKFYICIFLLCLVFISLGIGFGLYTKEFYIITALVPLGFLLLVLDMFCVYCYEYYLRDMGHGVDNLNGIKEELRRPPKYEDIFSNEIGKY